MSDARKKCLQLEKKTRIICQEMWDNLNRDYTPDTDMDAAILETEKKCKSIIHSTNMKKNDIIQDAIAEKESHIWTVVDENAKLY